MPTSVRITAPCRIHFGLLSLDATQEERLFGGAGVMLEQPSLEILVSKTEQVQCVGPLGHRVEAFIDRWRLHTGIKAAVRCEVLRSPPEHVGLGLGTQLGLSVAWALDTLFDRTDIGLEERAMSVGRGQRSAVGTYGFHSGGLIVEDGKTACEPLGRLHERIELPTDWRVLLVRLDGASGLAGEEELSAFATLPRVPREVSEALRLELYDRLLPAAREGDFQTFSESVYRYGCAAGECFSASQGGPFLSSNIAEFVALCRQLGVPGVGQSSWGPTVFCWFPHTRAADAFVKRQLPRLANFWADTTVSAVAQRGAELAVVAD